MANRQVAKSATSERQFIATPLFGELCDLAVNKIAALRREIRSPGGKYDIKLK
jgi:hypothetical protein